MASIKDTQKRYATRAMIIAICVALIAIVLGYRHFGKGLVLGTLFSIINFILMGMMLPARLQGSRNRMTLKSLTGICFRYALLAVPLIAAIKLPQFDLTAAVIGLFMVPIVILADHLKGKRTGNTTIERNSA